MRHIIFGLAVFAAIPAATASNLEEGAACARFKWDLAKEATLLAAPEGEVASGGTWDKGVGAAFTVTLAPVSEVKFLQPPERESGADTFGAIVRLPAAPAGRYQVSLSDRAWIDLVQSGASVASDDFTGEEGCPVRKSVRFTLKNEDFTLQLSGAGAATIAVVVTPAAEE